VYSATSLDEWMNELGSRLGQIHIHDNNGIYDEHLPIGEGNFPFQQFFSMIRERDVNPIITLESHTEQNLWKMLEKIKAMKLLV
jgi:sugar phosphate isomerase/epimerase